MMHLYVRILSVGQRKADAALSDGVQHSQFSAGRHKRIWTEVSQKTLPERRRLQEPLGITTLNRHNNMADQRGLTLSKDFWVQGSYSCPAASTHCLTASSNMLCSLISLRYSSAF